jgi:hypothetical protein
MPACDTISRVQVLCRVILVLEEIKNTFLAYSALQYTESKGLHEKQAWQL